MRRIPRLWVLASVSRALLLSRWGTNQADPSEENPGLDSGVLSVDVGITNEKER